MIYDLYIGNWLNTLKKVVKNEANKKVAIEVQNNM
jgi:hypothetical protein